MKILRSGPLVALSLVLGGSFVLALSGCGDSNAEGDDSGSGGNEALGGDSGSTTGGADGTGATGSGGADGSGGGDGLGGEGGGSDGSGGDGSGGEPPTCVEPSHGLRYWWNQVPNQPPRPDEEFDEIDVLNRAQAHVQGVQQYSGTSDGIVGWSLSFVEPLFLQAFYDSMPFSTVEFWVRTGVEDGLLVTGDKYDLRIEDGVVAWEFRDAGDTSSGPGTDGVYRLVSSTRVDDQEDHHIATTLEIDNQDPTKSWLRLFIDGEEQESLALDEAVHYPMHASTEGGGLIFGGNAGTLQDTAYFTGYLDEISLYDAPLDASAIQAIFEAGSAGKCLPGGEPEQPRGPQIPAGQ